MCKILKILKRYKFIRNISCKLGYHEEYIRWKLHPATQRKNSTGEYESWIHESREKYCRHCNTYLEYLPSNCYNLGIYHEEEN